MSKINQFTKRLFVGLVGLYQCLVSPFLGNCCRFHPSCSRYAQEAFKTHGVLKGTCYTLWRICRCNPWCEGGCDPVLPEKKQKG